jgi:hypothetical protein
MFASFNRKHGATVIFMVVAAAALARRAVHVFCLKLWLLRFFKRITNNECSKDEQFFVVFASGSSTSYTGPRRARVITGATSAASTSGSGVTRAL